MKVSGYKEKVQLINELFQNDYSSFTLDLMRGFIQIGSPTVPLKYEVDSLANTWKCLFSDSVFIGKNFQTDVYLFLSVCGCEFDCCFFIDNGNFKKQIWVNLETKSNLGVKATTKAKLKEQVKNHAEKMMPDYLDNLIYLSIGFYENEFVDAVMKNGKSIKRMSFNDISNLLENSKGVVDSSAFINSLSNTNDIRNTIHDILNGTFKYYLDTKKHIIQIEKAIKSYKCIGCYADAGSGKSILALNLFFYLVNQTNCKVKMLILNKKFYFELNLNDYYKSGQSFFGTDQFIDSINSETIAILDETQRISIELLTSIVQKAKCTVFFGDVRQSFYKTDNIDSFEEISNIILKETGYSVKQIKIKESKRYDNSVQKALDVLTKLGSPQPIKERGLSDYRIHLYYDKDKFFNDYMESDDKRMFIPCEDRERILADGCLNKYKLSLLERKEDIFKEYNTQAIGDTFHAISFDIPNNFIFLNYITLTKLSNQKCLSESHFESAINKRKFLNELNILFTRGTKSLHIYVNDIKAYLFIVSRLNQVGFSTN